MRVNVENHLLAQSLIKYLDIYIPYNMVNLIRSITKQERQAYFNKTFPMYRIREKENLSLDGSRSSAGLCMTCKCEQEVCLHIIHFCIMYIFCFHSDVAIKHTDSKFLQGKIVYFISKITVHHWGKSEPELKEEVEAKQWMNTAYSLFIWLSYTTQDNFLRDGLFTVSWVLLHQTSNKKTLTKIAKG